MPLYKGRCNAHISNYCPIALLNTDYRLLAISLAHRWGPALAGSIGPEKTAYMPKEKEKKNYVGSEAFMPRKLTGESILLPHALARQS